MKQKCTLQLFMHIVLVSTIVIFFCDISGVSCKGKAINRWRNVFPFPKVVIHKAINDLIFLTVNQYMLVCHPMIWVCISRYMTFYREQKSSDALFDIYIILCSN